MKLAALALTAALSTCAHMVPAVAQEAQCFTADSILEALVSDGYEAKFIGINDAGNATVVLIDEGGQWLAVVLTQSGAGCIVSGGPDSEIIKDKPNV